MVLLTFLSRGAEDCGLSQHDGLTWFICHDFVAQLYTSKYLIFVADAAKHFCNQCSTVSSPSLPADRLNRFRGVECYKFSFG